MRCGCCRFKPKPMVATTAEDIIAARGVKPCLSPNLNVLATVEALQVHNHAPADSSVRSRVVHGKRFHLARSHLSSSD